MCEVLDDVLRHAVSERCVVWVSGELCLASDDSPVLSVGL